MEEKLSLRRASHQAFLSGVARQMRREPEFTDVTLACDDNQTIHAQKLMLAAGSPMFRDILRKHPHPLIYIRGVNRSQLEEMLNFIYYGETSLLEGDLEEFLALGEDFKNQGLGDLEPSPVQAARQEEKEVGKEGEKGPQESGRAHVKDKENKLFKEADNVTFEMKIHNDVQTLIEDCDNEENDDKKEEIEEEDNKVPILPKGVDLEELEADLETGESVLPVEDSIKDESVTPSGWQADSDGVNSDQSKPTAQCFVCLKWNRWWCNEAKRRRHMTSMHTKGLVPWRCTKDFCGTEFLTQWDMIKHRRNCIFTCPRCGWTTTRVNRPMGHLKQ